MKTTNNRCVLALGYFLFAISLLFVSGCSRPSFLVGIGTGGKYMEARDEITRRRGGNADKAILNLEGIVRDNPTYKDSLTLLGRAYYMKGRYGDAFQMLQRAVAINSEDEVAWMVLGMTQLRLGDDEKGLKAVQGGLTLLGKATSDSDGYRGYRFWDRAGKVKTALRRSIAAARKGLEDKTNLIGSVENVLSAVDEEEWTQGTEQTLERGRY